ncbi:beta-L-arabinofuranosidase domain-containing protein [Paenibacillus macerans]|uniref:beta-L-arabinofuranosidase domain-containing protein n=1 Tax=Paenibacillus macerans TaxID=44252 RepID=UPI00203F05D4|nr:beta-L-arabinofuranosidase domain-containing protein [Paenibacillus macerans]MCM3699520.1 glycoside hydrolase family 127 protein [Paenibacillus macerans]
MSSKRSDLEIVQEDMEALHLGNLKTVEFDIHLPHEGKNGSQITWVSKDDRWIDGSGKVHQPEYGKGDRVVPVTATFQYGEASLQKVFEVTILEEKNKIQVDKIFPIVIKQEPNQEFYLPSAVSIQTVSGDVLAHSVTWSGGGKRVFSENGEYNAAGHLTDTLYEVEAIILIENGNKIAKLSHTKLQLHPIPVRNVRLQGPSLPKTAQDRRLQFLLSVNDDQMIYNFRQAAGLDTLNAPAMIGWDADDSLLKGHTTGHYLSALALCYAATGNERIHQKLAYMITELNKVQLAFEADDRYHYGFLSAYSEEQFDLLEKYTRYPAIWAPYYTLHKILAGLLDSYQLAGIEPALTIADKIGDWIYNRLSVLPHEQLKKMWGMYIAGEFGGINESLAELYTYTHKEHHIAAAKLFDNDRLFFPMQQQVDALGALHANQHIPQVVGAFKIFEATGEQKYYDIAKFFWESVVNAHIYSIGGTGEGEMFKQPHKIGVHLTEHTAETCASYNMLKLTKQLFGVEKDVKYMDYYERTMLNHILSSTDHEYLGASTYFMPTSPGGQKGFDEENSCCHGTGLENHFKYAEAIYFEDADSLYVNLFVSSELNDENKGVQVVQSVPEVFGGEIELHIESLARANLKVRKPYWHDGEVKVFVNQAEVTAAEENGYIVLSQKWGKGDKITIKFAPRLRLEYMPDQADIASLAFGPYILAAVSEQKDYFELPVNEGNLAEKFERVAGSNRFIYKDQQLEFAPLAELNHEHYHLYIKTI